MIKLKNICLLLIGLIIFFPHTVICDPLKVILSLSVKEEYSDNVLFNISDEIDDFINTVSPGLEVKHVGERLEADLLAILDMISYADNSKLNSIDHNYKGNLSYQLTPKTALSVNAGSKKDSRNDRDIEVDEFGDATGLLMGNSIRNRYTFGFDGNSILTEKTSSSFSCSFRKDDFDDLEENDLRIYNVNFGLTRYLSFIDDLTVGRLNFSYGNYDYLDSEHIRILGLGFASHSFYNSDMDYYSATIGISRSFSEVFSILVDLGGNYTDSEYESRIQYKINGIPVSERKERNENQGTGFVTNVTISYKGESSRCNLNFYTDVRPSSGNTGPTERTAAGFDYNRRFAYKLWGNLSTQFFLNKADPGKYSRQGTDKQTYSIRTGLRYEFTKDLSADVSYNFIRVKDKDDDTEKNRNVFFVRIKYKYPLFE